MPQAIFLPYFLRMKEVMMKSISDKKLYYIQLLFFSVIGFIVIFHRSRMGVDLTDETWYSSEPYWVAKGSIPYVNNWTQASGFTLPLNLFTYLILFLESEYFCSIFPITLQGWK